MNTEKGKEHQRPDFHKESVTGFLNIIKELPPLIDDPHPCLVINDLPETIRLLSPTISDEEVIELQNELFGTMQRNIDPRFNVYFLDKSYIYGQLTAAISSRESRGIISIPRSLQIDPAEESIFELNISRNEAGDIVGRVGSNETLDEQIDNVSRWVDQQDLRELLIVDDVLAHGGTLVSVIEKIKRSNPDLDLQALVGIASSDGEWRGVERVQEQTEVDVNFLTKVVASEPTDWSSGMAIPVLRKRTVFGGRVAEEDKFEFPVIYPSFLPFSEPASETAGRDTNGEFSLKLLEFSKKIATQIEESNGQSLLIKDLVENNIGIPYTSIQSLKVKMDIPQEDMLVSEYIDSCEDKLRENLNNALKENGN